MADPMRPEDVPPDLGPMTVCAHQGERCWPCQTGGCYDQPTEHPWWDADDVEHARNTGQPPPTGLCGCAWCGLAAMAKAERIARDNEDIDRPLTARGESATGQDER